MTAPDQDRLGEGEVAVTQADRDAAAWKYGERHRADSDGFSEMMRIRAGEWDTAPAVQSEVPHRLATERTAEARVGEREGLRAALESTLRALAEDSTPIIRRFARIQARAALEKDLSA